MGQSSRGFTKSFIVCYGGSISLLTVISGSWNIEITDSGEDSVTSIGTTIENYILSAYEKLRGETMKNRLMLKFRLVSFNQEDRVIVAELEK